MWRRPLTKARRSTDSKRSESRSVVSDSLRPHSGVAPQAPLSMGFFWQGYWSGLPCPPPGDLPNPGIKPRSPTFWAESLMSEPPGKPKNTGVGSLSLLQQIFPTQESNWALLPCRRILYQLSHQRGKPPADGSKALPSRAGSLPADLLKWSK